MALDPRTAKWCFVAPSFGQPGNWILCANWDGRGQLITTSNVDPIGIEAIAPSLNWKQIEESLSPFKITSALLSLGGIMGFALWLFLLGKGLEALGISLVEPEEEKEEATQD